MPVVNKLSVQQRQGLAIGLLLLIAVLFVHNPTSGYEWVQELSVVDGLPPTAECSMSRLDALVANHDKKTIAEEREEDRLVAACFPSAIDESEEILPFRAWRSRGALLPWFASPENSLWAMFAIAAATLSWVWLLRPQPALVEEA